MEDINWDKIKSVLTSVRNTKKLEHELKSEKSEIRYLIKQ